MKQSKSWGLAIIAITYILASVLGIFVFLKLPELPVAVRVLLADIAATVLVYFVGALAGNATVYDPYWSVQPVVITAGLALFYGRMDTGIFLLLTVICFWGVRLTVNWVTTFQNLNKQDWRYDHFKHKFPRLYPLVSFLGIHMFPTVVVFLALLPAMEFARSPDFNLLTAAGFVLSLGAALMQWLADLQMHAFRKTRTNQDSLIRDGLWKYSRHPNYLSEILMWWGVFLMMLSAAPEKWFLGLGALVNTVMFLTVSIPLADRRNSQKPGFKAYKAETRSLLPIRRGINPLNRTEQQEG